MLFILIIIPHSSSTQWRCNLNYLNEGMKNKKQYKLILTLEGQSDIFISTLNYLIKFFLFVCFTIYYLSILSMQHLNPIFPVELSGVLELRAATR